MHRDESSDRTPRRARRIWYDATTIAPRIRRTASARAVANDERYGLVWPGKAEALAAADAPSEARLVARRDLSRAFDAAQHAVVEGENLDALRLLRAACPGSVQLVYLDPPYNRGHDRAYPDDYSAPRGGAARADDGGRLHARWLSMMAPRLVLARELLSDDGVIAVSIDELEVARLRLLLEEVFGESNFLAEIVVALNPKGRQLAPHFATSHEYVLLFARDVRRTALVAATRDGVDPADFPREDERGRHRLLPLRNTNKKFNPATSRTMHFALWAHPEDGRVRAEPFERALEVRPVFGDGAPAVWRWSAARVAREPDSVVARWIDGALGRRLDVFQVDRWTPERTKKLRTIWTSDEIGSTDDAVNELKALVGPVFPTPKPVGLLRRLLATMPRDAVVLDAFAGSGTTGQAVVEANAEDGGSRRCVLLQSAEPTAKGGDADQRGYATIAAIARARLRAAIERAAPDAGFRAFELAPGAGPGDGELLSALLRRADA